MDDMKRMEFFKNKMKIGEKQSVLENTVALNLANLHPIMKAAKLDSHSICLSFSSDNQKVYEIEVTGRSKKPPQVKATIYENGGEQVFDISFTDEEFESL